MPVEGTIFYLKSSYMINALIAYLRPNAHSILAGVQYWNNGVSTLIQRRWLSINIETKSFSKLCARWDIYQSAVLIKNKCWKISIMLKRTYFFIRQMTISKGIQIVWLNLFLDTSGPSQKRVYSGMKESVLPLERNLSD